MRGKVCQASPHLGHWVSTGSGRSSVFKVPSVHLWFASTTSFGVEAAIVSVADAQSGWWTDLRIHCWCHLSLPLGTRWFLRNSTNCETDWSSLTSDLGNYLQASLQHLLVSEFLQFCVKLFWGWAHEMVAHERCSASPCRILLCRLEMVQYNISAYQL